jgi:threonine aldolase
MRQSGFLAAAGIYALEHNIGRLKEDNARARYLGGILGTMPYVESVMPSETNILIFTLKNDYTEKEFLKKLKEHDIHALSLGPQQVRFVTHLDFTEDMMGLVEKAIRNIEF